MQRNLKRLVAAVLLGTALALGAVGAGYLAQPTMTVATDPGGGNNGGGGG
jgi:hypothetical protein